MNDEFFWQVFADTGDPLCWRMHRAAEKYNKKGRAEDGLRP